MLTSARGKEPRTPQSMLITVALKGFLLKHHSFNIETGEGTINIDCGGAGVYKFANDQKKGTFFVERGGGGAPGAR